MKNKRNPDLKKIMKDKSITQYDLSLKLGISETSVYRMLNHNLSKEDHKRITEALKELNK